MYRSPQSKSVTVLDCNDTNCFTFKELTLLHVIENLHQWKFLLFAKSFKPFDLKRMHFFMLETFYRTQLEWWWFFKYICVRPCKSDINRFKFAGAALINGQLMFSKQWSRTCVHPNVHSLHMWGTHVPAVNAFHVPSPCPSTLSIILGRDFMPPKDISTREKECGLISGLCTFAFHAMCEHIARRDCDGKNRMLVKHV